MENNTATFGNDTAIEIIELHKNEIELIHGLRKRFRFGEVIILMRDGLPVRWKQVTIFGDPDNP